MTLAAIKKIALPRIDKLPRVVSRDSEVKDGGVEPKVAEMTLTALRVKAGLKFS